jgi:hypothetical protein
MARGNRKSLDARFPQRASFVRNATACCVDITNKTTLKLFTDAAVAKRALEV